MFIEGEDIGHLYSLNGRFVVDNVRNSADRHVIGDVEVKCHVTGMGVRRSGVQISLTDIG